MCSIVGLSNLVRIREGILADLFNKDFFKDHINTCLDGEVYWSRIAQYTNLEFNSSNRVAPSL